MESFYTFILAHKKDADQINQYSTGLNWYFSIEDDPTRRHWCSTSNGLPSAKLSATVPLEALESEIEWLNKEGNTLSGHLVIHATNEDEAENIRALIHGGILLGYPDPQNTLLQGTVASTEISHDSLNDKFFRYWFKQYDQTFYGCQVAARAWGNEALIYAIEKYRFSLSLDSFTPHSAHPRHGQVFAHEYSSYSELVSACFAVTAAYSVIEELGLEVRSSGEKPRFIKGEKVDRVWNPVVLEDLDSRLQKANMSAATNFLWIYRGEPTAAEDESSKKAPVFGSESRWFGERGGEVRDREMPLADAIHLVSWLRNFLTAHKFSELTQAISPYDVHNCQLVARRLILGALNLWRGEDKEQ